MIPTIALTFGRQAIESRNRAVFLIALFLSVTAVSCSSNSATITAPSPSKCELSLSLATSTIDSSGGSGQLALTTTPECTWTATTQATWISGISPASGQGSGEIEFRVAANSLPSAREAHVVVNDQRALVRQAAAECRFEVAPDALDVSADGGSESLTVTTLTGCAWSAASDVSWISVTPSSGSAGSVVRLNIERNTGVTRTGTVRVAGRTVAVRQGALAAPPTAPTPPTPPSPPACNPVIAPSGQTVDAAGGGGGPVTVSAPAGCSWTTISNAPWITITGGQSGNGAGTVTFSVAANTGGTRTGTLTIAGHTFVVTQSGVAGCSYTVSPTSQSVGPGGGSPPVIQVVTTSNCAWTATSNVTWVTIRSGASGTGNGAVTYEVSANPGAARTATLTVAGQPVTITQGAAAPSCTYVIAPTSASAPALGGNVTTAVTAPGGCSWNATSSASWITVTSGQAGSGNGNVTLAVSANTGAARVGTVSIAGQTFTVTQAAVVPCAYIISPTSWEVDEDGGNGPRITVTTTSECAWTATSNVPWMRITEGESETGSGTVRFRVDRNTGGPRQGTLTVAGHTFTVTQSGG